MTLCHILPERRGWLNMINLIIFINLFCACSYLSIYLFYICSYLSISWSINLIIFINLFCACSNLSIYLSIYHSSIFLSINLSTHTHTHTHIYIYIYIYTLLRNWIEPEIEKIFWKNQNGFREIDPHHKVWLSVEF